MKKLRNGLRSGNLEDFKTYLLNQSSVQRIRTNPQAGDSQEDITNARSALKSAIEGTIDIFMSDNPKSRLDKDATVQNIMSWIDQSDNTQVITIKKLDKTATKAEEKESDTKSLDDHLTQFYGLGSEGITMRLYQDMNDIVINAGYRNLNTGAFVERNTHTLNTNLWREKDKQFKKLVKYMKLYLNSAAELSENLFKGQDNSETLNPYTSEFDFENYNKAMSLFYNKFAQDDRFTTRVQDAFLEVAGNTTMVAQSLRYKAIVSALMNTKEFSEAAKKAFPGMSFRYLQTRLYEADHLSEYYSWVLDYVNDPKNENTVRLAQEFVNDDIVKTLNDISAAPDITILDAANAYTILKHFDTLLKKSVGDQIRSGNSLKNYEGFIEDKYTYWHDISKQKKGWEQGESYGSEEFTSDFVKTLIGTLRIYDIDSGLYTGRRMNATTLLAAFTGVFDTLVNDQSVYNSVRGSAQSIENLYKSLREEIRSLRDHPTKSVKTILEMLFEKIPNLQSQTSLADCIARKGQINSSSLSILKSLYTEVYSEKNSKSFYSQNARRSSSLTLAINSLLSEISGYAMRNNAVNYSETTYNYNDRRFKMRMRRKFFNDQDLDRIQTNINLNVNTMSDDKIMTIAETRADKKYVDRAKLVKGLRNSPVTETTADKNNLYTVTLGGSQVTLSVPETVSMGLLGSDPLSGNSMKFSAPEGFFDMLNDVDLRDFRNRIIAMNNTGDHEAIMKALPENSGMRELYDVLWFLDTTLGTSFLLDPSSQLQILQIYKENYDARDNGMSNYLMPWIRLGIRSAFITNLRWSALKAGVSLETYLKTDRSTLYNNIGGTNSQIRRRYGKIDFEVASFRDWVLNQWADAQSIFGNDTLKSVTKDNSGNFIPNYSIANLGLNIQYQLYKSAQKKADGTSYSTAPLMFVKNPYMIRRVYYDIDVKGLDGTPKAVKQFTKGELFAHSILNRFFNHYIDDGTIIVQPTAYSDKPTMVTYEVDPTSYGGINLLTASEDEILEVFGSTLGQYYSNVNISTTSKMRRIVAASAGLDEATMTDGEFKAALHSMTEQQLVKKAQELGLEVERFKDYKILNDGSGHIGLNELIQYNDRLFNSPELLQRELQRQKAEFVSLLIQNGCVFQVLTGNDTLSHYTGYEVHKSKNATSVLSTILDLFAKDTNQGARRKRMNYMSSWVDPDTGRLILAKQTGADGTVKNIISLADNFDPANTSGLVLNPLLNTYFMCDSLFGNNLRMSLTGSEINHPEGKNAPLSIAKRVATVEEWNKYFPQAPITDANIFNAFKNVVNSCSDVLDLQDMVDAGVDEALSPVLEALLDRSYSFATSTSQLTQTKRNVPITGTLQYVMQNDYESVPEKTRCAVLEDVMAPVFNYDGEDDTIASCDGSGLITPFQAILENRGLGDNKAGFIRKPMVNSYDPDNGTSTLLKFAVATISNDTMRSTLNSDIRHYNLFKKMTNEQWRGDIDLTKTIRSDRVFSDSENDQRIKSNWFTKIILDGEGLFYRNRQGQIIQITDFGKDNGIYYTKEKVAGSVDSARKRYHLFYDGRLPDGRIEKSRHMIVDTLAEAEEALERMRAEGGHTINSLFELHTSLGGIWCVDHTGVYSERNNEVVVNFMNNIGSKKAGTPRDALLDQTNCVQPLKNYQIGYAVNLTACKCGAKNLNPVSSWSDDTDLTWFNLNSSSLGIQLNADHEVIDSEMTEFSQVMAACTAYGWTYEQAKEIFQGLGQSAIEGSDRLYNSLRDYLANVDGAAREQARMSMYDVIGRIMFTNYRIKDDSSLVRIIMQAVQREFNKYRNHINDAVKMPFSEKNMFDGFVSTLASTITSQSIRRKHSGIGDVIVGAYNMIQYFEIPDSHGGVEKLNIEDILVRAREAYRDDLLRYLRGLESYNADTDKLKGSRGLAFSAMSWAELETIALREDPTGSFSDYYSDETDQTAAERTMVTTWLSKIQPREFKDASWFMPEDIVEIVHNGEVVETIVLDSMEKYHNFKRRSNELSQNGYRFRASVTHPYNLRPALIRWQYRGEDGVQRYMNIFDTKALQNSYAKGGRINEEERADIQRTLQAVHDGFFYDDNGNRVEIIPGSLENSDAEIIMSDLYQNIFDTKGTTIAEVLRQGEGFFRDRMNPIYIPEVSGYDVAFLKGSGDHTLVTFGDVKVDGNIITNTSIGRLMTSDDGAVMMMSNGREVMQVGQWADVDDVRYDEEKDVFFTDTTSENADKKILNHADYRISNGKVQKRYKLLTKYNSLLRTQSKSTGKYIQRRYALYQVADLDTFRKAFGNRAEAKQAEIVSGLYDAGDYTMIELNGDIKSDKTRIDRVKTGLGYIRSSYKASTRMKEYLSMQLNNLNNPEKYPDIRVRENKKSFLNEEAHKKWVSFQDSRKFIAARIPAQSLQSFMTMNVVGWTGTMSNAAFVSHFQTYLQGSDYDIDKAYIMGQHYTDGSHYNGWSTYFDFGDLELLELSKTLPVPKGIRVEVNSNGVDITAEIDAMLANSTIESYTHRLDSSHRTLDQRKVFLRNLISALRKVETANGQFKYSGDANDDTIESVRLTLSIHENHPPVGHDREDMFKNAASANVYAVGHDIRNREQAYTAITLRGLREVSANTPKGKTESNRNMLNPFIKLLIQYDNLLGKSVVAITANGQKFWFYNSYHWLNTLINGSQEDIDKLRFSITLDRIQGRAKGTKYDPDLNTLCDPKSRTRTVSCLPDLARDNEMRNILLNTFHAKPGDLNYKHVDQMISQFISAATDNAKELILAKLNADANFTRMYLYLLTIGFDVNDIAAFMTSPTGELVAQLSMQNIFQNDSMNNTPYQALSLAQGLISSRSFLSNQPLRTRRAWDEDQDYTDTDTSEGRQMMKSDSVTSRLLDATEEGKENKYSVLGQRALQIIKEKNPDSKTETRTDVKRLGLNKVMQGFILAATEAGTAVDFRDLVGIKSDIEVQNYLTYCNDLLVKLLATVSQYKNGYKAYMVDIQEYAKIYDYASEISDITTGWLKFNQGIPTDMTDLLDTLRKMAKVITNRETKLGIDGDKMFKSDNEDIRNKAREKAIKAISENNPVFIPLTGTPSEQATVKARVLDALQKAYNAGVMNNTDILRLITDPEYRQAMSEYLYYIKGTTNVIDLLYSIPQYEQALNGLAIELTAMSQFSVKGRMLQEFNKDKIKKIDENEISREEKYTDVLMLMEFLKSDRIDPVVLNTQTEGYTRRLRKTQTNMFDLSTESGIVGFVNFVKTKYVDFLRSAYADNSLVKHLRPINDNGTISIGLDIDMSAIDKSKDTMNAYQEIVSGMAKFENEFPKLHPGYSVADILALFNIIMNFNSPGKERLTGAFRKTTSKSGVLYKYFEFKGDMDVSDGEFKPDYNTKDLEIARAPLISEYEEQYHTEPYVLVRDDVWKVILKESTPYGYKEVSVSPALEDSTSTQEERSEARAVIMDNMPFITPEYWKRRSIIQILGDEETMSASDIEDFKTLLGDLIKARKVTFPIICD